MTLESTKANVASLDQLDGLQWAQGAGAFELSGAYLTDEAKCPICGCPNHFEFLESFASPVRCIVGCRHLRMRELRDGWNWYGFEVNA